MMPYVLTIIELIIAASSPYVNPSIVAVPYVREGKELN